MSRSPIAQALIDNAAELRDALRPLTFGPPVTHVYNPLEYAWDLHVQYLESFAASEREVLFVGMNPGPWGMAQTGVPFGEVSIVRDWLGLRGEVGAPPEVHPARPVLGLACKRSEVSGQRLWGWARDTFVTPERFFQRFLIMNYCPLMFMEASGRNRTPDKLPARESAPLFAACDRSLANLVRIVRPKLVVGIGGFAHERAASVLEGTGVRVGRILHPSPASPLANRGWAGHAAKELAALGVALAPA